MKKVSRILAAASLSALAAMAAAQTGAHEQTSAAKQQVLWDKLESQVRAIDRNLDGVMGVAIEDLTTRQKFLLHEDEVFPQASSIKITVLAELYHQAQLSAGGASGKAKLTDLYVMNQKDLVQDSDIMSGLTPGVTRVTNRDLATMMVAVSDNSAANVLIDRVGIENVNALLRSLGLRQSKLQRKMMDVKAASQGRENIATPREMMTLLAEIYRGKLFGKALSDDF